MNELRGNVFTPEVIRGKDGKSAYEIAKDKGFQGSEEQWLASLHAPNTTIPVCVVDVPGLLMDVWEDLQIESILELCDDDDGHSEECNISRVTNQNQSVIAFNNAMEFILSVYFGRFTRTNTYLSMIPSSSFAYMYVHFVFNDGSSRYVEIPGGFDHRFELSTDIALIYVEIME